VNFPSTNQLRVRTWAPNGTLFDTAFYIVVY
jgi:hypothetical protein